MRHRKAFLIAAAAHAAFVGGTAIFSFFVRDVSGLIFAIGFADLPVTFLDALVLDHSLVKSMRIAEEWSAVWIWGRFLLVHLVFGSLWFGSFMALCLRAIWALDAKIRASPPPSWWHQWLREWNE